MVRFPASSYDLSANSLVDPPLHKEINYAQTKLFSLMEKMPERKA